MYASNEIIKKSIAGKKGAQARWQKDAVPLAKDANKNKIKLNKTKLINIINELTITNNYVKDEVAKFIDYWTETNKSGTKMRFELEKTWDTSRRLKRWMNSNFGKTKVSKIQDQTNSWAEARKRIENE